MSEASPLIRRSEYEQQSTSLRTLPPQQRYQAPSTRVVMSYSFATTLHTGVRVARKHISWYTKGLAGSAAFRHAMNQLQTGAEQLAAVNAFFAELAAQGQRLQYIEELAA